MKLIALMMMMVMVSAAPSHPTDVLSSHGDQVTLVLNEEENSTRKDTINITISDFPNCLISIFRISVFQRCFLPTCGTVNIGSALQVGDEKAGSATNDPYGNGKK
ncbi:uncharacterized protein zgc:193726 isoform X1 [Channa argus]|uniref:uncharacterized protein zgc:193726 isoform X1 n=1 Tax=Channa argus TaxID=215402 RepID=UPI002945B626|nr:hypothetical protein Q8A73_021702 [Channa argus]